MERCRALFTKPPLVHQAEEIAAQCAFSASSLPEVGRLLHVLASQITTGRIGEIGTGCGVGAAWMVSALRPNVTFFSVELDQSRATAVQSLFRHLPNVHILHGDWHQLLDHSPFDLLFADGGRVKQHKPEQILAALRHGGLLVLDDLTPLEHWPPEWQGQPDPVRASWLNDTRVAATEIQVTATSAVILATRL